MPGFNNQQTQDGYTNALTISGVTDSKGGSVDIKGANVLYQLEGPNLGAWTDDKAASVGSLSIYPGTLGIKFRSAVAGQPATVSATIAGAHEPLATVAATGSAATSPSTALTGIVASNGTVTGGSGFTVNRTGVGTYVITYSSAFAAQPVVIPSLEAINGHIAVTSPTASGCTILTTNLPGGAADIAFEFLAMATV